MVEHLVFFKFKDGTSKQDVEALHQGLRKLKKTVPGVVELTVGHNFTARGQGFTTGLYVRLKDRAALDEYSKHPEHVAVVETLVKPHLADIMAIDYDV
jgi:hypothetical protein